MDRKASPHLLDNGMSQQGMASAQIALAETSTALDAVEALMLRCADEIMSLTGAKRIPTEQERMRYYAWRSYMVRQSIRVVDRLFDLSGGHALYLQHPLQRIWRRAPLAASRSGEGYGKTFWASSGCL